MDEEVESAAKPQKGLGIALAVVLGLGVVVMAIWAVLGNREEPKSAEPNYTGAIMACRDAVRPSLKDPDSAEFSSETYSENEDGERWRIRGTVRSTNSFGAVVPSQYECVATWQGEAFSASVTSLG